MTLSRLAEHKRSRFHKPVPLSGLYQSKPICPRHPGPLWEVIKRLAATSSTGISPPHGSHAAALIACDGFALENAITLGL